MGPLIQSLSKSMPLNKVPLLTWLGLNANILSVELLWTVTLLDEIVITCGLHTCNAGPIDPHKLGLASVLLC